MNNENTNFNHDDLILRSVFVFPVIMQTGQDCYAAPSVNSNFLKQII